MTEQIRKLELTASFIKAAPAPASRTLYWDTLTSGLALQIQPSGHKCFKLIYRFDGRVRWYSIGSAAQVDLKDARAAARLARARVTLGQDPQAERIARRLAAKSGERFREVCARYLEQEGKKQRAWKQGEAARRRHVLPKIGDKRVAEITRGDVEAIFDALTTASKTVTANQVLSHMRVVLGWAVKKGLIAFNPAAGIEEHKTVARERVLEDEEIPEFWDALAAERDAEARALKVLLLLGQRPGEIRFMRREDLRIGAHDFEQHRADGSVVHLSAEGAWWKMPGAPDGTWPGTKNGRAHEVWIPACVLEIIAPFLSDRETYVFRGARRGRPIHQPGMVSLCKRLSWEGPRHATPHDLRRTHGTMITRLGFGRDVMNRIENHAEGGIADVYDQHKYRAEKRQVSEAVAARILALAERRGAPGNVSELRAQAPGAPVAKRSIR